MKIHRLPLLISLILIAGCASQEPEYKWVKNTKSSKEKEYTVADSICLAEAYKASPESGLSDCFMLRGSISRGACMGEREGKAKGLRDKIYDGCMLSKGWEKQPIK